MFDINQVIKDYELLIQKAAASFPESEREDSAQEIRIWLWYKLKEYEKYKKDYPLFIYIRNQIGFCLRRLYHDVRRQEKFERDLIPFARPGGRWDTIDRFDLLIDTILKQLDQFDRTIFYALLYNSKAYTYKKLSEALKIDYMKFRGSVLRIRNLVKKIAKNHPIYKNLI